MKTVPSASNIGLQSGSFITDSTINEPAVDGLEKENTHTSAAQEELYKGLRTESHPDWEPLSHLPEEYQLRRIQRRPDEPLLHYGFIVPPQTCLDFVKKNKLFDDRLREADCDNVDFVSSPTLTPGLRDVIAWVKLLKYLRKKTGVELQSEHPRSPNAFRMIALYSNYNRHRAQLASADEEAEVIETIKKELDLDPDVPSLWWWGYPPK
ncbi:hypothetical protein OF83DRAFT_1175203 [Amylostereum chailletii]|nr:hypothetical protein OF83DRAFT_1175203 [Amylostereum chailletii]